MEKDPVCGVETDRQRSPIKISEHGGDHRLCSEPRRNEYIPGNKGWFTRLIEWLARGNRDKYGGGKPSCCGR